VQYLAPILIACLLPFPALADDVILTEGSRLSGTVTTMADDGRISLSSDLAFDPFQVKAECIQRVIFDNGKPAPADESDALLVLANGDQFPCELQDISTTSLRVSTTFAGPLEIARDRVSTVQLGVRPRKIIYQGPDNAEGWAIRSGWRHEQKRFIADGAGSIARAFEVPASFALKFRVIWRTTPNLHVFFADDTMEPTARADRYQFSFDGSSGFSLKRQMSETQTYKDMHSIRRDPSDYADSQVDVELRVDRKMKPPCVHLLINGEYEGKFSDPAKIAPSGKGIMFLSKIGSDDQMVVDNIEIREWDPAADRHLGESRGDETRDVVITRSSDRGTGSILGMATGKTGPQILYKSPHYEEPVELPAAEVSTLFFAKAAGPLPESKAPWQLGLRGRGFLGVSGCSFSGESLTAEHPLLGKLEIRRDAIGRLERKEAEPEDEPEPEEGAEEDE
jgi:hypothetical protein